MYPTRTVTILALVAAAHSAVFAANSTTTKADSDIKGIASSIRHRFLGIDESRNQLIHVDQFNPTNDWQLTLPAKCRDYQLVGENHLLLSTPDGFCECDLNSRRIVREVKGFPGTVFARRLRGGSTVLGHDTPKGLALSFIDSTGKNYRNAVVGSHNARLGRLTPQNTILVGDNQTLVEASLTGKIIRTIKPQTDCKHLYQALRKPNGNLILTTGYAASVVEINPDGKLVRTWGGTNLRNAKPLGLHFFSGFQILLNKNIVTCNWTGHGAQDSTKGVQLVEFNSAGKPVWTWHNPKIAGSLHGVIVLDQVNPECLNTDDTSILGADIYDANILSSLECRPDVDFPNLEQVVNGLAAQFPDTYNPEPHLQAITALEKRYEADHNDPGILPELRELRRQVLLNNPLIPSKDLLFIQHNPCPIPDHRRGHHMCDQYFGYNAETNGSGLFVLENAFSTNPIPHNLLDTAICENGRFKGQRLQGGSVLSPDLSYDGKTILFAYTEGVKQISVWNEHTTWHIFKINTDGTGLTQLTDGGFNDFDPCWLPNGRIMFISERRRGFFYKDLTTPADFGRCHGRPVPTYSLHAMEADGSNMRCLSWHDTNEFHPSVNNDGLIVYTRWDYVDRGAEQAHHLWITTPDGRNPRAIQGNYIPGRWVGAPNMENSVRAIPGSHKLVATAMAHHGESYGSLVLIDPSVPDDFKLSQLKRLTPDARFPEITCGAGNDWKYATAWPLNEDWYLCVYDPQGHGGAHINNDNYRIILLHAPTGLKEVIYQNKDASCLSPTPLCARSCPPIVPDASSLFTDPITAPKPATVSIANIYDSHIPFPKDAKITTLRIVHILTKTTPNADQPNIGYASQSLARQILGTVPVEADGSVYFTMPASIPVYFQALDENGCAVQSMKSETYAQPGERVSCLGCHEPQGQAPTAKLQCLAFKREPSIIQPEPDGSNPFSYPRLIQPVLDKNCVTCHEQNKGKAPDLSRGNYQRDPNRWYASYHHLRNYAWFYGFCGRAWTPPFSTPGQIGARQSRLYPLLTKGHHGVKLSPDELRRIIVWLDTNSNFLGTYENLDDQAAGKIVTPKLE